MGAKMLIGVVGKKGSGKDTFAEGLMPQFENLKFAAPIKEMLRALYRYAGFSEDEIKRRIEGDLKEKICPLLGTTPRWAMQTLGTEWAQMLEPEQGVWRRIWEKNYMTRETPAVVTDVRFEAEAALIKQWGGTLVRIERPLQTHTDTHPSEVEMDNIQTDYTLQNDGGIKELREKAKEIQLQKFNQELSDLCSVYHHQLGEVFEEFKEEMRSLVYSALSMGVSKEDVDAVAEQEVQQWVSKIEKWTENDLS